MMTEHNLGNPYYTKLLVYMLTLLVNFVALLTTVRESIAKWQFKIKFLLLV